MKTEELAVVAYGVLALLLTFAFAVWMSSPWGAALAVAATGITYIFQALQHAIGYEDTAPIAGVILTALWAIIAVLIVMSALVSMFG